MKFFFMILVALSFGSLGFAAETSTECLMMRESNDRSNPKANLAAIKPRPKSKSAASAQ